MAASNVESGTKTGATISDKCQVQPKKIFAVAKTSTSAKEIIPEFFYPFALVF